MVLSRKILFSFLIFSSRIHAAIATQVPSSKELTPIESIFTSTHQANENARLPRPQECTGPARLRFDSEVFASVKCWQTDQPALIEGSGLGFISNLSSETPSVASDNIASHLTQGIYDNNVYFRSFSLRSLQRQKFWHNLRTDFREKPHAAERFDVPKSDFAQVGYALSNNRYKEVVHEEVEHRKTQEILDDLEGIEKEIMQGMKQLRGILK